MASWVLYVAWTAIVLATAIVVFLILRPGPGWVPRSRRRPTMEDVRARAGAVMAAVRTSRVELFLAERGLNLPLALEQAGVKRAPREVALVVLAAAAALTIVAYVFRGFGFALVIAVVIPALAWVWLQIMIRRRRSAFANQLDETLQNIAGSLKAGFSLGQALAQVGQEAEAPMSEEFSRINNEIRVGRPMPEALQDSATRMANEDFYWVTQAIAINREVGGNLAEVLEGVGKTIRDRNELREHVKGLSAEGRLSAIILGGLPFAMGMIMEVINPEYLNQLFTTQIGLSMLVFGLISLGIGILWLRKTIQLNF